MPNDLEEWKAELEAANKRTLRAGEISYLDHIEELVEALDWRDSLYGRDLATLEQEFPISKKEPQKTYGSDLWTEKPDNPYSLWQYIALILIDNGFAIPEFLQASTEAEKTRSEIRERQRLKESHLWKNRLANLALRPTHHIEKKLDVRMRLQGRIARWESRIEGTSDYIDLPAKELTDWLNKGYGFLDRFASSCLALCALMQDYYRATQRIRLDLDKAEDRAMLNLIIQRSDTKELIVGREGLPLNRSDDRLCWQGISRGADADGYYQMQLGFDDRRPAPTPLAYLPGTPALYLCGDTVLEGPALPKPDADPNAPQEIPQEALESPEGLLFTRKLKIELPESLRNAITPVAMQRFLRCRIITEKDGAQNQILDTRILAISRDRRYWFSLTEDSWEQSDNLENHSPFPEAEEKTVFDLPDHLDCLEALRSFSMEEEDTGIWHSQIDHDFPRKFRNWIQSLPSELQIDVDEELDTLLDPRPSGRYLLSVAASDQPDWFDLSLVPEIIDDSLSATERKLLLEAKGEYVRLPGKGWKRFEIDVNAKQRATLENLGIAPDGQDTESMRFHALQLAETDLSEAAAEDLAKEIRKRAKSLSRGNPPNTPKGITTDLRPYQLDGFRFLTFLSQNGFGGILADDMGLGKTLQCLTWLAWLKHRVEEGESFRTLVVCPKSVSHVWVQETKTHSNFLSIAAFDPNNPRLFSSDENRPDILVANYTQLRIHSGFFLKHSWTACVLDEGQYIKNPSSQTAKTARSLNATHRLVLTGTPVENKALDLWSLFAYAMPGLLGSQKSFTSQYNESKANTPSRLFIRTRHFLLRRTKSQVAPELPDRTEETLACDMEGIQFEMYQAEISQTRSQLLSFQSDTQFQQERFNILASLLRMRQICCHPRLIDPTLIDARSAKLDAVLELVGELKDEGHKVLIFSQFVEMLEIIQDELIKMNCSHLILTGQTQNREELIDRFQTDSSINVFLLSLRAASFGLNLTAASYVVLFDPWWNPAVEAQAIDRTHRIGQKNAVNAYRLIARNSVEEKIQSLQLKKETLANEIVREDSLNQVLDLDTLRQVLGT